MSFIRTMVRRLLLPIVLVWAAPYLRADQLEDYRLGRNDKIAIQVFGEDDLSMEVRLSDTGTISYPFLGEIQIVGVTVSQLQQRIVEGLKGDFLIDPNVNVSVLEYRQFYIYGEVKNPGGFPYTPGLTVAKAVALAGGFTERASKSKIKVVREGESADREAKLTSVNEPVQPGDTITVEQSFF